MITHYSISKWMLVEEIELLNKANKIVLYILPAYINSLGEVETFLIIFKDKEMKIDKIFEKCLSLTMKKRQDYTSKPEVDSHENFKRSAEIASWFINKDDKPYAVLIATKLSRLATLLSGDKDPQNESVADSFEDLINYCALWYERCSNDLKGIVQGIPGEIYETKGNNVSHEKIFAGTMSSAQLRACQCPACKTELAFRCLK